MDRRTFLETGTVLAGSLLAGCVDPVRSAFENERAVKGTCDADSRPWPTAGGDPGRTGWTDTDPPAEDADSVDLLASFREDGRQRLASSLPAVVNHMAYIPTGSELVALTLDSPTEEPAWTRDLEDDVGAVPTVACGVVLVPGLNQVTALDLRSGNAYWHADIGGHEETTIGALDETAYVAGVNPASVDIRTGEIQWNAEGGDTLAFDEDGIYTTRNVNGTGGIVAHDHDGEERWRLALGKIVGSASVENGTVWVGDNQGTVYAIDAATGETHWSRSLAGVTKIHSGLAVHGDDVIVPAGTGQTSVVLNAETGETRWTADTGIVTGRPVIGNDWVGFGRTNTGISVYERTTGEERVTWSRDDYDLGTVAGIVPIENGFIVRGGTTSGLTLLR